jgi:iron complex outermembrane recepter protein
MQIQMLRRLAALECAPVAVAMLAMSCAAMAETPEPVAPPVDEAPTVLDSIIVRSSPFGLSADELVRPIDVLSGEALERRRRGTIGDVLADRPGVSSASFGPGVGRPVIRGQGGPRVLVLDNGIGTMDASSISADHAVAVDPLGAYQIEVIKGPATLIYGGGASAGVVNVVDDRLPEHVTPGFRLRSDLSYGSNADERTGALRGRYGIGHWQFGGDYSRREAGEFSIPGYATRLTEDQIAGHEGHDHAEDHHHDDDVGRWNRLENSDLQTERYGFSGAWAGPQGMLGAAVSRFEAQYGIPGHAHEHEHGEGDEDEHAGHSHEGVRINLEQTRVDLRGLLNDPFEHFDRLETRVGVNDYQHAEVDGEGNVGTTFDVQELELRTELAHRPMAGWVGVGGVQLTHRDFEAVGLEAFVPPVVTRGLGLFLVEGRPFGEHRLELGARVDRVSHSADDPGTGIDPTALRSTSYLPTALSADVAFMLDEHLHLRFNLQRAQRAPAAEEVYAFGPHLATLAFERGDLDLKLETANN